MSSDEVLTPSRYFGRRGRPVSDGRITKLRNERAKRFNPFDADLRSRIRSPAWSPTVMTCPEKTPPQALRVTLFASFSSWNIDQLSKLSHIDIESSPSSHQECECLSPDAEERLQEDIRTFFANFKLPSPSGGSGQSSARHLFRENSQFNLSNLSHGSRRSLELSFNQSMEISMTSDSSVEERRVHGSLIKSPNSDEVSCADISMDSPSGCRITDRNSSFFHESGLEL